MWTRSSGSRVSATDGAHRRVTRARAVERLIDRDLILQQMKIQPQAPVTDKEVDAQLMQLRKDIPACKRQHCETDAGWKKYVSDHGFTVDELRERWGSGWRCCGLSSSGSAWASHLRPRRSRATTRTRCCRQYAKQNVTPPKLEAISDRIQEVLLQQQVTRLLDDWLKSLRAQGRVRIVGPGRGAGANDLSSHRGTRAPRKRSVMRRKPLAHWCVDRWGCCCC